MKDLTNLINNPWMEALGWSLLHSVWQCMLITIIVWISLKFISHRASQLRYLISAAGLALTLVAIITTFVFVLPSTGTERAIQTVVEQATSSALQDAGAVETSVSLFQSTIESNMNLILAGWFLGTCFFILRIVGGWMYLLRIRNQATTIDNEWSALLQDLTAQLNINSSVLLAESKWIETPMVMGYLKPVILIPVGLFSGLTTEQVETIFLHELAHIKRHDFLINLIQSLVEAILFFNPFVWVLSNMMRQEREYCCDDAVISQKDKALTYAHALAKLEEARLSRSVLALTLAGNKNQLLNRIKRIMERSVKSYSGAEKLVPALLIVAGLTCASWITIQAKGEQKADHQSQDLQSKQVQNDTTKKDKSARYHYRKRIVTNEEGEPVEEIIENYHDEDLRIAIDPVHPVAPAHWEDVEIIPDVPNMIIDIAQMPDMIVDLPAMPHEVFGFADPADPFVAPFPDMFLSDTTRRKFRSQEEWRQFSEEFEKKFKERFKDFYEKNEKDINRMMEEVSSKLEAKFDNKEFHRMEEELRARAFELQRRAELAQADVSLRAMAQMDAQAALAARNSELQMRQSELHQRRELEALQGHLDEHSDHLRKIERDMRELEENMKAFEKELKEQLLKDGYISKDEQIKHMEWSDDGDLKVNDKKIKSSDRKKYSELHRKYFKDQPGSFHFVE
jgi:bla regulator protein blaR1